MPGSKGDILMKCFFSRCIVIILVLAGAICPLHATDLSSSGAPHPHGITSGGLGTAVTSEGTAFNITGGTQKGANLFHSFGKFNIHSGEAAVFHDAGIENTVGRVTGGDYSWINGSLTSGAENLYLMNPAGIMFGAGASLNLNGSFHATTADYLKMGENEKFHAAPQADEVLSVAAPSAFGFLDDSPGKISAENSFLTVREGKTLTLAGGNIQMHDSTLFAGGGEIVMAAGASAGEITITENGPEMNGFEKQGELSVTRDSDFKRPHENFYYADIDTSSTKKGNSGGSLYIRGEKFELTGGSVSSDNHGSENGGDIDIRATGDIAIDGAGMSDGGTISANTSSSGNAGNIIMKADAVAVKNDGFIGSATIGTEASAGNGGDIEIEAATIDFSGGAWISSATSGTGNSGMIRLKADESVSFQGESIYGSSAVQVMSEYEGENSGNAGSLEIQAENIVFSDGAWINSNTYGTGNGGTVTLNAGKSVSFAGEGTRNSSQIQVAAESKGDGGDLEIRAQNIRFTGGAGINSANYGTGKGGTVTLNAFESVLFDGEGGNNSSQIYLGTEYEGEGGGDGGSLEIRAKNITFTDGAWINSATFGTGLGGTVALNARESVSFAGEGTKENSSRIYMGTEYKGEGGGNGGGLEIQARDIAFADGAYINSASYGTGNGGTVALNADNAVTFAGEGSRRSSQIYMTAEYDGEGGDAGSLEIQAQDIAFTGGAWVNSSTYGTGSGGTVTLKADESVIFSGEGTENPSLIQLSGSDTGDAGRLEIQGRHIAFSDGAMIDSRTFGTGKGGDVTLKADESVSFAGEGSYGPSLIQVSTQDKGDGGSLEIQSKDIAFTGGAWINSAAYGTGKGATVALKADELVSFAGEGTQGESLIQLISVSEGDGGSLEIEAPNIVFTDGARLNSAAYGTGNGGTISLKAGESVSFDGEGVRSPSQIQLTTEYEGKDGGDGGSLEIRASSIIFSGGAGINSASYGTGNGGTINLTAGESVSFEGEGDKNPSLIQLTTEYEGKGGGKGGRLEIEASNIAFAGGAWINSAAYGTGNGGIIKLKAGESVLIAGESSYGPSGISLAAAYEGEDAGDGGSLEIQAGNIAFAEGGQINSATYGTGKGGTVRLKAGESVSIAGEGSDGPSGISLGTVYKGEDAGDGGSLEIQAGNIAFAEGGQINSATYGTGNGGTVTLKADESVSFAGEGAYLLMISMYEEEDAGDGGNLLIEADNILFTGGAAIFGSTLGKGNAGAITLKAEDSVLFSGEGSELPTLITISTHYKKEGGGKGGELVIEAGRILFADGAAITGTTAGTGDAGDITLIGKKQISLTGRTAEGNASRLLAETTPESAGSGGTIWINTEKLLLNDGAAVATGASASDDAGKIILEISRAELDNGASVSSESTSSREDAGEAGAVIIAKKVKIENDEDGTIIGIIEPLEPADSVTLKNKSQITTDAESAGGGEINIQTKDALHLSDSEITTSVNQGEGGGGDIRIGNPDTNSGSRFVTLNHSRIKANADEGDGGAVFIVTENFIKSSDSIVEAKSDRGNQGEVKIEAPDLDIAGTLTLMPESFINAARWLPKACRERTGEDVSRFIIRGRDCVPVSFSAWLPAPPVPSEALKEDDNPKRKKRPEPGLFEAEKK
jgi:filamentous hemagglutinin family protein